MINRINLRIILLQDAVFWSDDYDLYNKKLNSLIYSISNILDNGDDRYYFRTYSAIFCAAEYDVLMSYLEKRRKGIDRK